MDMEAENREEQNSDRGQTVETPVSPLTESDAAFIREKIKDRPINKGKLLRRTLITAIPAIIFGGVACLTFLFLEPFFSARISPEEEPQVVTFPTSDDEIQPEDLYADDAEIASAQEASVAESIQASVTESIQASIEATESDRVNAAVSAALSAALADFKLTEDNAGDIYRSLKAVASEAERSLVLVRAATTESDFVGGTIERSGETPGLIVADNGVELLILTYASILSEDTTLSVTWYGGEVSFAAPKMSDTDSGLCVLSVTKRDISQNTRSQIQPATLGSTLGSSITGTPVIAVGSPVGLYRSVCYGMITSEKTMIDRTDQAFKVFATDIYGGGASSGFLLNYAGQVIGVIYPEVLEGVDENRVIAYSISEIKKLIEHLVNAAGIARLGIHGADMTSETAEALGAPEGAYVLRTEMESPAMAAGLQSGDIIVAFDDKPISSWESFVAALDSALPGDTISLEILRKGPEEYLSIQLTMTTEEEVGA